MLVQFVEDADVVDEEVVLAGHLEGFLDRLVFLPAGAFDFGGDEDEFWAVGDQFVDMTVFDAIDVEGVSIWFPKHSEAMEDRRVKIFNTAGVRGDMVQAISARM